MQEYVFTHTHTHTHTHTWQVGRLAQTWSGKGSMLQTESRNPLRSISSIIRSCHASSKTRTHARTHARTNTHTHTRTHTHTHTHTHAHAHGAHTRAHTQHKLWSVRRLDVRRTHACCTSHAHAHAHAHAEAHQPTYTRTLATQDAWLLLPLPLLLDAEPPSPLPNILKAQSPSILSVQSHWIPTF